MRIILSLTHFIGISLIQELSKYELERLEELGDPTFNLIFTFAIAIIAGNLELYISLQRYLRVHEIVEKLINEEISLIKRIKQEPCKVIQDLLKLREELVKRGINLDEAYKRMYRLFEGEPS